METFELRFRHVGKVDYNGYFKTLEEVRFLEFKSFSFETNRIKGDNGVFSRFTIRINYELIHRDFMNTFSIKEEQYEDFLAYLTKFKSNFASKNIIRMSFEDLKESIVFCFKTKENQNHGFEILKD